MPPHVSLRPLLTLLASPTLVVAWTLLMSSGCASTTRQQEDLAPPTASHGNPEEADEPATDATPEATDQRSGGSSLASPRPNSVCLPDGTTCQLPQQCCEGNCASTPGLGRVCKPAGATMTCLPEGRSCKTDQECCTGACLLDASLGRVCKPKGSNQVCRPRSLTCRVDQDCCSGACIQDLALGAVCK